MRRWLSGRFLWVATLVLLGLLLVLGALQTRWMNEIMDAQHQRMRDSVEASSRRFGGAFLEELIRPIWTFEAAFGRDGRVDPESIAEAYRRWSDAALTPGLVTSVYFLDSVSAPESILRYRSEDQTLREVQWPKDLRAAIDSAKSSLSHFGPPTIPLYDRFLVVPSFGFRRARRGFRPGAQTDPLAVLELDLSVLEDRLIPQLVREYFPEAVELEMAVSTLHGERVLYQTPDLSFDFFESVDVSMPLLDPRSQFRGGPRPDRRHPRPGLRPGRVPRERPLRAVGRARRDARPFESDEISSASEQDGWFLLVRHQQGSFFQAVRTIRNRNLGLSLGILALLGTSIVLVVHSSRRLVALSEQKMEFVAGVSHELRTPLAVIRSAGQNLSEGTVSEKERIREYGSLIEREGRRLTRLVDQVLEFAGIQSGARTFHPQAIEFGSFIDDVLEEARWLVEETSMELTSSIDYRGQLVVDRDAFRRAILNLVGNAVNHAAEGKWLGVHAALSEGSEPSELRLAVSDRGPGIESSELTSLFDSFVRGSRARERQIRGSGLGLTLVRRTMEAMGGGVEVDSTPGKGSTFTLTLPVRFDESHDPASPDTTDDLTDDPRDT